MRGLLFAFVNIVLIDDTFLAVFSFVTVKYDVEAHLLKEEIRAAKHAWWFGFLQGRAEWDQKVIRCFNTDFDEKVKEK